MFLLKGFVSDFIHSLFNVRVRQISSKIILHAILEIL